MKRALLFLLCALMSTQMFSETLFGYLFPTLAYLERTTCYYTEGDEQYRTINRLNFEDNMFEIDGNDYIEYNDFWLREDKEGRILVYSEPAKKDLVLYDFTLEVGDTLTTLNIDMVPMTEGDPILPGLKSVVVDYPIYINGELSCPIDSLIVTDVSMVMMRDSNEYKKWTFSNGMEYMEYIGNLGADFFPIIKNPWEPIPTCCIEERLVCASIYDRLIYQMDDAEMQRLNAECQCSSWASKWCDTWNVLEFNGMAFEQTAQTWQYKLAYDTIIDGKEYQAVTRHWTADEEKTKEYVAAVRFEENSKAFIYYDNAEYLLYDFNFDLIEGDTLEVFAGINNYVHFNTYKCVIKSVEQTEGGITESTYSMDIIDPFTGKVFPSPMVWKEFVGSYNGILHGDLLVPGNSNYHLLCAYKNSSIVYSTEDEVFTEYGCEYNAVGQSPEDLFPTLWGLQRTSCSEYVDCQKNETYLMQADEIKEINGKQYLKYGGVFLREEDSKVLIYSFPYEKDFVLYDWTLEVGDTLQILGVDPFSFPELEYTAVVDYVAFEEYDANGNRTIVKKPLGNKRVKDISTMRLLDGNEYKAWLFGYDWERGNYYVEGIGNASKYGGDYVDLVYPFEVPSCYFGERLVCVSRDGVLLYQIDDAEMERLGAECLCDVEKKWTDTWCDTWNVLEHDRQYSGSGNYNEQTWRHYLAQDTIINGQTYTFVNCYWTLEESKVYRIALVRFTEDKKVYLLSGNQEQLVYDFSVEVGDTIETIVGAFYDNTRQQLVVHQVDVDDATNRKTITLYPLCKLKEDFDCDQCDENGYYLSECCPVQWIEGVGSTDGFLMGDLPCSDWVGGVGYKLLCAYKNDELQYISKLYQGDYGCEYNAVEQNAADLFPTLWGLQRTVCNEYCGDTEDDNSANFTYKQTFDSIFFENDKPYILCNGYLLREEDNKIFLYSQSLNKDIVLYDFTLEVGDSLPAYIKDFDGTMYSDDILVVTDISSVTLLDGKEYKKWTFDNGMEYVEGIGMYGGRRNGNFFGLIQEIVVPCHTGTHLVCVSKNNKLLYQMDDTEMERLGAECLCDYDRGPRKDNAKDGQIGGRPTPTQWNQLELDLREMDNGTTILRAETFSYTLENDSVVANDKTFYQLARQSTKDTATTKSFVGALHFGKDEDNRVYFLRDGVEYVLYDFTAEPGDTVEIFAGINNYPQDSTYTHVVVDKDTTEDGACRMFLEVVFPEETTTATNAEKVWLAGLGSIDGIVHNTATRTSNAHATPARSANSETQTSVMLCAWREDSCLYITDHPDYNDIGCIYNQDPTSIEDTHSPSPIADYQKLLRDGQLLIIHKGKTYNVLGVQVK
ncbi:MAG: hypothetical protein IKW35_09175 [Paludibacteraceae bacterium]|nr:hypothetical protein [Paludibacteraceae bacterium]